MHQTEVSQPVHGFAKLRRVNRHRHIARNNLCAIRPNIGLASMPGVGQEAVLLDTTGVKGGIIWRVVIQVKG